MSITRPFILSLVAIAACSSSESASKPVVEEPWSHAYSGAPDGWWLDWNAESLGGEVPYGPGTRFEFETLAAGGIRTTEVFEVLAIEPQPSGEVKLQLESSAMSTSYWDRIPRRLEYLGGVIASRSEHLVSVTVPAGTFKAGRLWKPEKNGHIPYERDIWVVRYLPMPVQSWYRSTVTMDHYDPPADGEPFPEGAVLTRLIRIDRK